VEFPAACNSNLNNVILRYYVLVILKMGSYKFILLAGFLMVYSLSGLSQNTNWNLVGGKAIAEKKIIMPGKTQHDIYKEVYRWLIKVYKNPEDILKARIENEYLRGLGYNSNFLKFGEISGADLQYIFAFEINEEWVIFKVYQALIIDNTHENHQPHPVENYFIALDESGKKNKKVEESKRILASLNDFTNSLFASLENHLLVK
jgi:hypothetical protein